jgi:hypothetical protein
MLYSKLYERFYSLRIKIANITGEFFSFHPNRLYLIAITLVQAASWWLSYYVYKNLTGDLLVLHYNVDFGIDWVGDQNLIFYFPMIGLIFLFLSIILLFIFGPGRHFRIQSHYLMASAVLANLGMLASIILVYIINFR